MSSDDSTVLFPALPEEFRLSSTEKRSLKNFASVLANQVADGRGFTCVVTNDRELRRLNSSFLGHDYPTDVLSFPSGEGNGQLGEIAISAERAYSQAAAFGHGHLDEIRILMLHGVLHLIGMDHEIDHGEMARAERKWRSVLSLPVTLIARTSGVGSQR